MTCARCGATNAPDADWCGLCHERFAPIERPPLRVSVPLVRSAMRRRRVQAVFVALGSIVVGATFTFGLLALMFVFSLWGSPVDVASAVLPGAIIAGVGVIAVTIMWVKGEREPALVVDDETVELVFPGFHRPMVVPRANVRAVIFDERPVIPFNQNQRFPVVGDLSSVPFADPLDRLGVGVPPVVYAGTAPRAEPVIEVTDPEAGWATVGAAPPIIGHASEGWLYRPDGRALPLFALGAADVPNIAIIFHDPVRVPRARWAHLVSRYSIQTGRAIPGIMLRLTTPVAARVALQRWGIVRDHATAADVLDERLTLPKPLRGWRILAFAALVLGPMLVRLLLER